MQTFSVRRSDDSFTMSANAPLPPNDVPGSHLVMICWAGVVSPVLPSLYPVGSALPESAGNPELVGLLPWKRIQLVMTAAL